MKLIKLLFFVGLISITGCNSEEDDGKLVIGVSMLSMQNEFIVNVADEMEKKAEEMGVKLITVDAERSALKQMEQVESFIAQGVDAIILNPCEVEASSPAVSRAIAAGVPIVNVNSETTAKPSAFVGSNDVESARIAMNHIVELLNGKGNLVMIHGFMGQAAQIQREEGAKEILAAHPEMKLLAEQTGEWDRSKSMDLMQNWIQSYGDKIDAVFAHNDEMGMGAVKALQNAGMKEQVLVVSIDAIQDALQSVKNRELDATVFQNAREQGAAAVISAIKLANGETVDSKVLIPFQLVTQENIEDFLSL